MRRAAGALGTIGPAADDAAPALVAALKDPDDDLRRHAVYALGEIGPPAVETAPALVAVLKDPNVTVRRDAANALQRVLEYIMRCFRIAISRGISGALLALFEILEFRTLPPTGFRRLAEVIYILFNM